MNTFTLNEVKCCSGYLVYSIVKDIELFLHFDNHQIRHTTKDESLLTLQMAIWIFLKQYVFADG